jgi:TPR repeat protein
MKYISLLLTTLLATSAFASEFEKTLELAEKGDAVAQYNLAIMYDYGDGITLNDEEAFKWYLKAAIQGYKDAQNSVGNMYDLGEGVEENNAEAMKWYLKAAQQDDNKAINNIAALYETGDGVSKNLAKAEEWYLKGAKKGDATSQINLSLLLAKEREFVEAFYWAEKSAKQGNADAQAFLGGLYAEGYGVIQNEIYAYVWLSISKALGALVAQDELVTLSLFMTPEKIEKAKSIANKCWKSNYEYCD